MAGDATPGHAESRGQQFTSLTPTQTGIIIPPHHLLRLMQYFSHTPTEGRHGQTNAGKGKIQLWRQEKWAQRPPSHGRTNEMSSMVSHGSGCYSCAVHNQLCLYGMTPLPFFGSPGNLCSNWRWFSNRLHSLPNFPAELTEAQAGQKAYPRSGRESMSWVRLDLSLFLAFHPLLFLLDHC